MTNKANMENMRCHYCGSDLYIREMTKTGYDFFCPYCLNLPPIEKDKSLELLRNYLSKVKKIASECLSSFSKEKIIKDFTNFREISFKENEAISYNLERCVISTLIIRDCLKNNSVQTTFDSIPYNFQDLCFFYEQLYFINNSIIEVEQDFFRVFSLSEKLKIVPNIKKVSFVLEKEEYCCIPKQIWQHYIDTSENSTFLSTRLRKDRSLAKQEEKVVSINQEINKINSEIEKATKKRKKELQKQKEILKKMNISSTIEKIYNGFYAAYLNEHDLSFKEFESVDLEGPVFKIIGKLIEYNKGTKCKSDSLYYSITLKEFNMICESSSGNMEECYEILVSSKKDCKEFPLIIELNSEILVCPKFLTFIWPSILFKYSKTFKDETGNLQGKKFELEVAKIFESHNFRLEHPYHKNVKLIRKVITFKDTYTDFPQISPQK